MLGSGQSESKMGYLQLGSLRKEEPIGTRHSGIGHCAELTREYASIMPRIEGLGPIDSFDSDGSYPSLPANGIGGGMISVQKAVLNGASERNGHEH
jgi:hypothetical protein